MMLLDIFTFTGHLHPLVVHLPIGFLLLALVFDLLSYHKKYTFLQPAVAIILLAGFIASVLSCVFGYMLSLSGDYNYNTLTNHKVSGIALTVMSGVLYILKTPAFKARFSFPSRIFSVLVVSLVGLMSYAGHQGGNLTHGSDYLNLAMLLEKQRPKPATVEDAYIFEDVVHPVLVKKCGQCHQAGKLKGRLSVQSLQTLLKGGKTGAAIVAGKLTSSELYKRITLDPHDEKFMPTDGKTPLTKQETAVIKWWIEKAMAVENTKMAALKDKEAIKPQVAAVLGLDGSGDTNEQDAVVQSINPGIPIQIDSRLIDNLRNKGFMVRVMLKKPVMLDVTLPANANKKMPDVKDDLLKVSKHIVWLNLSDNGFTGNDLAILKEMSNLEKLRLEYNPVGDEIAGYLSALKHLEAVNLNNTHITEAGLKKLKENEAIRRVYAEKL